jgi:hypothetical protein
VFPSHCGLCGAALMGGATRHAKTCPLYNISVAGINDKLAERPPVKVEEAKDKKCARTACDRRRAVCKHTQTGKMYCVPCARAINEHNPGLVIIPPMNKR